MAKNGTSTTKPETRAKAEAFKVEAPLQSLAIAASQHEREDQDFSDGLGIKASPEK